MREKNIFIIGAGPAGIACAYELAKNNILSYLIEKEDLPCGICKTIEYKGFRFDIGPHRFFTKSKFVEDLWKSLLKEDFLLKKRCTHIFFNKKFFLYPIKISDVLIKLGILESILVILDYLVSDISYKFKKEESFEDWVIKNFGKRLYKAFFKTYTEKIWGISSSEISSDWAAQRIKGLSLFSAVKNAFFKGKGRIKTLIDKFYYPKYGVGQMYVKMLEEALSKGVQLFLNNELVEVGREKKKVKYIILKDKKGEIKRINADYLVSSIPFSILFKILRPSPPPLILNSAKRLKYRSLIEVCLIVEGETEFKDQWIYIHEPHFKVGRIQLYKNWSKYLFPKETPFIHLGMEYFCFKEDEMWNKTDSEILRLANSELSKIGIIRRLKIIDGFVVRVPYAYPVYTKYYKRDMKLLREYIEKIENLQVIGRCGMHRYNNMDHSILTGIYAAQNIILGKKKYDLWKVNVEKEYLEEYSS